MDGQGIAESRYMLASEGAKLGPLRLGDGVEKPGSRRMERWR